MLSFIALGDWGRRGDADQHAVARGMARAARRHDVQFVLSTGDNFYEHGVTDARDPHWRESFEAVYDDPALNVPWYASLGNHDHEGDVQAQIAYTQQSVRWHLPDRYYAINKRVDDRAHVQIVVLDTTPFADLDLASSRASSELSNGARSGARGDGLAHPETLSGIAPSAPAPSNGATPNGATPNGATPNGATPNGNGTSPNGARSGRGLPVQGTVYDPTLQAYWLRHMLAPSRSAWRIVVGHHPIRSGSDFHGDTSALGDALRPILNQFGVQAYLSGHEHDLQHLEEDGLHYVVSGAGSQYRPTGSCELTHFCRSTLGFAVVTLTSDVMTIRFCDADGTEIYATDVPRATDEALMRHDL